MPQPPERTVKLLGGRNLPAYWDRFDRLQRTAARLRGGAGPPRGVFRFPTFAAFEAWQRRQRMKQTGREKDALDRLFLEEKLRGR